MLRRALLFGLALGAADIAPALAQDMVASITGQLHDQGFADVEVQRTLLGRTRILATNGSGQREIIVNPNTGEILRDLWQPSDGSSGVRVLIEDSARDSGNSDSDSDDDDSSGSNSGSGNDDGGDHSGSGGGSDRDNSGGGSGGDSDGGSDGGSGSGHGGGDSGGGDD